MNKEKSEAETKLTKLRNSWNKRIEEENNRYEKLLQDLKASQADKFSELNNKLEVQI
jgi:hypothetical protein